jgi:O-antigen ligase
MDLDAIFAYVVGGLAGLAVIGALAFALVWEWCAIRRTLAAHRRQAPDQGSFWRDHTAVTIPERRP